MNWLAHIRQRENFDVLEDIIIGPFWLKLISFPNYTSESMHCKCKMLCIHGVVEQDWFNSNRFQFSRQKLNYWNVTVRLMWDHNKSDAVKCCRVNFIPTINLVHCITRHTFAIQYLHLSSESLHAIACVLWLCHVIWTKPRTHTHMSANYVEIILLSIRYLLC